MSSEVNGENIFYYYFKDLSLDDKNPENRLLIAKMLRDLSIWLPIDLYKKLPILLPYVVRDNQCRKSANKKKIEEWCSCNSDGYLRDDNSLVKGIPKPFAIISKNKNYSKAKIGTGFVACHIWRELADGSGNAPRNPLTNTFVPNLVWLPKQLSKLTDREGSFSQKYMQFLSRERFEHIVLEQKKSKFVKKIWKLLPKPTGFDFENMRTKEWNYFDFPEKNIQVKVSKLLQNVNLIKTTSPKTKLHNQRYFETYSKLPNKTKKLFTDSLDEYVKILQ